MWLGTIETTNWEFIALGDTEKEVKSIMRKAWAMHQNQTGAWLDWDELKDDLKIVFIRQGDVLRDFQLLHTYDKPHN